MAIAKKYSDLKFDDEKLNIKQYLQMEDLPSVSRICSVESEDNSANSLTDMTVLMTRVYKEPFAHIKVLKFYDNAKMQSEKGGEYILEHETFVGCEYLLPIHFPRLVKFVRKPGRRGRYLTIKQVLGDRPAFVIAEDETQARLSSDLNNSVTIQPKTILELKRIYTNEAGGPDFLECSVDDTLYTFQEDDKVNFTVFEGDNLYTLTELSHTTLLPKVILFQEIDPEEAVLKDNELRSALLTMVEGPLEVLGFTEVKYLICWVRNNQHKSYETVLIPETLWTKIYVQKRSFFNDFEKEIYIKRKYCHCSTSDFFRKLLYILPVSNCNVTWLRCPDLFKRNLEDANKLYEVVQTPFLDSSDDDDDESRDHIYSTISEPPPPLPPKVPTSSAKQTVSVKRNKSIIKTIKHVFTHVGRNVSHTNKPERPPKPHEPEISESLMNVLDQPQRPLPCLPSNGSRNHKYTKLAFTETSDQIYDSANYSDKPYNIPEKKNLPEVKDLPEVSDLLEGNVLRANQTADDFFGYSVTEVSYCFKHCGLASLASLCQNQKLDGGFFKGIEDWNMFNLSRFETAVVNKVIYHGWRPKTDKNEYIV